jgi:hypothetical protein
MEETNENSILSWVKTSHSKSAHLLLYGGRQRWRGLKRGWACIFIYRCLRQKHVLLKLSLHTFHTVPTLTLASSQTWYTSPSAPRRHTAWSRLSITRLAVDHTLFDLDLVHKTWAQELTLAHCVPRGLHPLWQTLYSRETESVRMSDRKPILTLRSSATGTQTRLSWNDRTRHPATQTNAPRVYSILTQVQGSLLFERHVLCALIKWSLYSGSTCNSSPLYPHNSVELPKASCKPVMAKSCSSSLGIRPSFLQISCQWQPLAGVGVSTLSRAQVVPSHVTYPILFPSHLHLSPPAAAVVGLPVLCL